MKYFSKDLTLKQINSFINYSFHELKDTLIEKFNENYWDDKKITKKEFNYLIDVYEFDESFKSRVFAGYARTLIYRAKEINDELTENKRKEFIEYIFKNQVLFDYLKPQLIELNLDKEAVDIQLNINYYHRLGDSDSGYVGYVCNIDGYKFTDVVYDGKAYSSYPSDITNEYKKNERKYISEKTEVLLKHIKAYSFIDIRKEIYEIFQKSLSENLCFLDYSSIDIDIEKLLIRIRNEVYIVSKKWTNLG